MIQVLAYKEFQAKVNNQPVQLIDVRSAGEFQGGSIDGAICLDVNSPAFIEKAKDLINLDKPIYVFCRSGMRSNMAAGILSSLGATEIYDLEGGYINWKNHQ